MGLTKQEDAQRIQKRITRLKGQAASLEERISNIEEALDAKERELGQKPNPKERALLTLVKAELEVCNARQTYAEALLSLKTK